MEVIKAMIVVVEMKEFMEGMMVIVKGMVGITKVVAVVMMVMKEMMGRSRE